jgi:hypothetical protein
VRELIESALVPVMEARRDAAKTKDEKERALLSLTICDPAAGSGHFLLAAASVSGANWRASAAARPSRRPKPIGPHCAT